MGKVDYVRKQRCILHQSDVAAAPALQSLASKVNLGAKDGLARSAKQLYTAVTWLHRYVGIIEVPEGKCGPAAVASLLESFRCTAGPTSYTADTLLFQAVGAPWANARVATTTATTETAFNSALAPTALAFDDSCWTEEMPTDDIRTNIAEHVEVKDNETVDIHLALDSKAAPMSAHIAKRVDDVQRAYAKVMLKSKCLPPKAQLTDQGKTFDDGVETHLALRHQHRMGFEALRASSTESELDINEQLLSKAEAATKHVDALLFEHEERWLLSLTGYVSQLTSGTTPDGDTCWTVGVISNPTDVGKVKKLVEHKAVQSLADVFPQVERFKQKASNYCGRIRSSFMTKQAAMFTTAANLASEAKLWFGCLQVAHVVHVVVAAKPSTAQSSLADTRRLLASTKLMAALPTEVLKLLEDNMEAAPKLGKLQV